MRSVVQWKDQGGTRDKQTNKPLAGPIPEVERHRLRRENLLLLHNEWLLHYPPAAMYIRTSFM